MNQEAGNSYPDTPQETPLTLLEAVVIYGSFAAAAAVSAGMLVFGVGTVWRWLM